MSRKSGSTRSSSSTQNVAFVSSDNTSSTNEVNTAFGVSTSSGHKSQKEGSTSYTDDLVYSFFANQSSGPQLDHEDLEQVDEFDLKEIDLKWQTGHAKDDTEDYALMAFNSSNSGSDAEKLKKKKNIKTKLENFQSSSKGLSKLLNSHMSAKDKSGLGSSDVEDSHVNDRFLKVEEMHVVPPPMTGNYMPPKSNFGIDESKFTYGPKQSTTSESDAKIIWTDAPIIEEYDSDSDDEHVTIPSKEQEKPSFAFVNTVEHVKTPRQTAKEQNTCSQNPKPRKRDWNGLIGPQLDHEDLEQVDEFDLEEMDLKWQTGHAKDDTEDYALMAFNSSNSGSDAEKLKKKKNIKTKLEKFQSSSKGLSKLLNSHMSAKDKSRLGSSDVEDSHVNDRFSKVEEMHEVPPPMTGNYMPPKSDFGIDESKFTYGPKQSTTSESDAKISDNDSYESSSSAETLKTVPKPIESKPKVVNEPKVWTDAPIIEEHMTGNKAYLVDYQDFNGGHIDFGGSKGQITGKGKIQPGKLDFKDVYFVKEIRHFNLFYVSQMCDKKNKVLFTDTECLVLSPDFKLPDENQVLLRVPRQHNMYSFNLENIVPSGGLACLIAKATPIITENKTNKTTNPKETNNSARTQDSFEAGNSKMEADHAQEYYVLPVWSSYTSTVKSSKAKNGDEKLNEDIDSKTNEEPVDQEDQAFLEKLERLKRQEKVAHDAAETLRKSLEDIYKVSRNGIFTSASYDDEGAVANFTNLESTTNVNPIPTSKIHSIHPTTQILRDPTSAVQTRIKVNKSSGAYAFKEIRTKWVYRNKKDEKGVVVRNKARLVAQGHRQKEGIYYDELFAHVARIEAIKIFLAFASYMGFIVYQIDVKSAFLYDTINEEVFQMSSMNELTFFLGLQVKQKEDDIFISQDKYVAELLQKFDFLSVKTTSTPIETKKPLVKDEEARDVDVHIYRSMISSLMYLTASRPDIMYAVCACSRFQVTPKTSHLQAVKRIFRYLKGQPKLGLWYPRESVFDLKAYSDSDYAGANLDRKSTTGGCQFLGRRLISWQCKKQKIVASSTIEAEYVAAASCCRQVRIFIKKGKIKAKRKKPGTRMKRVQEIKAEDGRGEHSTIKINGLRGNQDLRVEIRAERIVLEA
nr:uncharacterized mitochondrial protein AtMg00810-like [Tanacetum cinerariifolium]